MTLLKRLEATRQVQFTASARDDDDPTPPVYINPDGPEAAALIRELVAEIERLREIHNEHGLYDPELARGPKVNAFEQVDVKAKQP